MGECHAGLTWGHLNAEAVQHMGLQQERGVLESGCV